MALVLRTERFLLEIAPHGPLGRHLSTPPQFSRLPDTFRPWNFFEKRTIGDIRHDFDPIRFEDDARTPNFGMLTRATPYLRETGI